MKNVAAGGRTVLFVSHSMQSVQVLCNRAMFLDRGVCSYYGEVQGAVDRYIASFKDDVSTIEDVRQRPGTGEYRITNFLPTKALFDCGEPKTFDVLIERCRSAPAGAYLNVSVMDSMGIKVAACDMRTSGLTLEPNAGATKARLTVKSPWLKPGDYWVNAKICNFGTVDLLENACRFAVSDVLPYAHFADALAYEGAVLADYVVTKQS